MLCKRARVCHGVGQKGLDIYFLSLSKLCFESRNFKLLSLDKYVNSFWAFDDRCVTSHSLVTNGSPIQLFFPELMSVEKYFQKSA